MNIYIIPTDQPSRFSLNSTGKYVLSNNLYENSTNFKNQNIYITHNDEVKDGDWCLPFYNGILDYINEQTIYKVEYGDFYYEDKKIILTTDPQLIENGIQSIGDDFLEWFIKNPNCLDVEVYEKTTDVNKNVLNMKIISKLTDTEFNNWLRDGGKLYKIIIPESNPFELPKALPDDVFYKSLEPKETLEEAAKKYANRELNKELTSKVGNFYGFSSSFIEGAEWQAERMYSLEDMYWAMNMAKGFTDGGKSDVDINNCFEQFKKK